VNDYSHREDPKARELGIWENEGGVWRAGGTGRPVDDGLDLI
jgi:hypothetical protein